MLTKTWDYAIFTLFEFFKLRSDYGLHAYAITEITHQNV